MDNGVDAWLVQRVTSLFLVSYFLPVLIFWAITPVALVDHWRLFLLSSEMRVLGGMASVALLIHACIGIWVVATDYIHIDFYQQAALSFFYLITTVSSAVMLVLLWSSGTGLG